MPQFQATKKVVTYEAADPSGPPPAKVSRKSQARQAQLLGADAPPSATAVVTAAANTAQANAKAAQVAKTAMGLRALAVTAEALRQLPGGGEAADTLLRSLDAAVNKGGQIAVTDGKLVRKKPKPEVGFAFPAIMTVAPFAMRAIGPAVAAARAGLARFGPALLANARTAASFVAGKVGGLLEKAKSIPGYEKVAGLVKKGLVVAGAALGIGTAAAAMTSAGRAKLKEGAKRAYAIARTGTETIAQGAAASGGQAAQAIAPDWLSTFREYAPWALGALAAFKVLT